MPNAVDLPDSSAPSDVSSASMIQGVVHWPRTAWAFVLNPKPLLVEALLDSNVHKLGRFVLMIRGILAIRTLVGLIALASVCRWVTI